MAILERTQAIIDRVNTKGVGVEVGVGRGMNAAGLLGRCPELKLILVDHWQPFPPSRHKDPALAGDLSKWKQRFLGCLERIGPYYGRWRILQGDSVAAASMFEANELDFVFVDGAHDRQSVINDINAWASKLVPGGILCGHDYGQPAEWCSEVKPAVDFWCSQMCVDNLEVGPDHTWFVRL